MTPFTAVSSHMCPLDVADVDTDQILPKQYLKRIERTGFGEFAFHGWRYRDGAPDPDFVMNRPEHRGAAILLAGRNFGCGSSREHAPWALQDAGFQAIVAPSFADIFRNNCANIGVLCVVLPEEQVRALFAIVAADPPWQLTVDLEGCTVVGDGFHAAFEVDAHVRHRLLHGLDAIALSLRSADRITAYEQRRESWRPRVTAAR